MNYIYDIVLNFQANYYQFFEWQRTDKIKNISKIMVFHVSDQDLTNLSYNQIIIDNVFLNQLKKDNKRYKKIMCIVSNTKQAIGLLFSNDGKLLKRSSLLFEEESEVNNLAKELPLIPISYLKNKKIPPNNKLRIEIEKKDTLVQYITTTNDILPLKYLYYEYFNKECNDTEHLKTSLLSILEQDWNPKQNNLYQIMKLLNQKNLPTK